VLVHPFYLRYMVFDQSLNSMTILKPLWNFLLLLNSILYINVFTKQNFLDSGEGL
jgi:hypothetical protein